MNQVLLGLFIPYTVAALIYTARRGRASIRMLILFPLVMLAGSLWAIAPDIPRILRNDALYDRLSRDPRCNIFFMHYTIDQMECDSPWYTAIFMLVIASLLYAAWRELKCREDI